jgi:DNA polymerase delta subunit 1
VVPSVFSDITEETRQRWLRPANQIKDNSQDVSLQWLDMDLTAGAPLEKNPNKAQSRVVGATNGQVPVVRAYGVSEAGNSVAVFIHGFTPYCYFALPANSTFQNTEENLTNIRRCVNNRLEGSARGSRLPEYCRAVSYVTSHKSIMGYDSPHTHFFKIMVAMPTLIPPLKRIMEEGIDLAGVQCDGEDLKYSAFECNVPFVLRYMIDQDISGAGWLTLPKKTYQIRADSKKQTHCQVCFKRL